MKKSDKKVLRVFEGFAGYGGGHFALTKLKEKFPNFEFEVIGYSEIDKYACELYDMNHKDSNGENIKNFGDITKLNPDDVPDFDIFMGGFPCQPFSTAGMQKGVDDPYGRGTLFQHIMRICEAKKPKYMLLENVKGFFSKKFESTRAQMEDMLRNMGYVADKKDKTESPLRVALLNSKDYGVPQNRERVWMFAKLGGLPKDFSMEPEKILNGLLMADFLDPKGYVPESMYLSEKQIEHLKEKHNIDSFKVDKALCFDVYNKKIKTDGYSITITMPEHNSLRVIESHKDKEVVRKMSVTEQFRLMGLEGLNIKGRKVDIVFGNQSYTQLSKRAGNGWDVNLVTILLEHVFRQLAEFDENWLD
ncbi:MAG: DNA cytosine methyltransferase [Candidatus Coprovivens sp.]